mmetsp:Transcript_37936/g.150871  ORF Transcript_37936/g.150871 Transcript_37936/m.150871 type:complete len:281 (-) Transcript_37936:130-972(-)
MFMSCFCLVPWVSKVDFQVKRRSAVVVCGLKDRERQKIDKSPDAFFYNTPRLVKHADDDWHKRLTSLYHQELPDGGRVLDLMSSWVSHLPKDMQFERVAATGMNREELSQNKQLTEFVVHDLNADPRIPFEDASFDAVVCALSVQYLQKPELIFSEIARVLRPRGVVIVSFSNRMFFTKAVNAWKDRSGRGRVKLVKGYMAEVGAFSPARDVTEASPLTTIAPLLGSFGFSYGGDPFYAVVANKYFAPSEDELEDIREGKLKWVFATGKSADSLRKSLDQ